MSTPAYKAQPQQIRTSLNCPAASLRVDDDHVCVDGMTLTLLKDCEILGVQYLDLIGNHDRFQFVRSVEAFNGKYPNLPPLTYSTVFKGGRFYAYVIRDYHLPLHAIKHLALCQSIKGDYLSNAQVIDQIENQPPQLSCDDKDDLLNDYIKASRSISFERKLSDIDYEVSEVLGKLPMIAQVAFQDALNRVHGEHSMRGDV